MASFDITSVSRKALEAAARPKQYSQEDLVKQAAVQAAQIIQQAQAQQNEATLQKTSRADQVRGVAYQAIGGISKVSYLMGVRDALLGRVKMSEEEAAALPEAEAAATGDAGALADALAEGDASEGELLQAMIEGASEDPAAASALASQLGDAMSPEEVEGAAEALAEATAGEESGVPKTAESMAKTSALQQFAKKAHPITTAVILKMSGKILDYVAQQNGR